MVTAAARKTTGRLGEEAAADHLRQQGYHIVDRNWSCRSGELDIVATKGEIIAFVEVKTRRAGAMVSPLQAVSYSKQHKVVTAACTYLLAHPCDLQPRFDVAAVTVRNGCYEVEYYESAYLAGNRY